MLQPNVLFSYCSDYSSARESVAIEPVDPRRILNSAETDGEGETPDPIPNSEVKPFIADGTAHKSVEE